MEIIFLEAYSLVAIQKVSCFYETRIYRIYNCPPQAQMPIKASRVRTIKSHLFKTDFITILKYISDLAILYGFPCISERAVSSQKDCHISELVGWITG
jgi:hypothetical protein